MDLVRMATARVVSLEPLYKETVPVRQSALVIGGGPAGMMAARTLAEQGFPVHLVERQDTLGGSLRNTYFAIPDFDTTTPQQLLGDLTAQITENPRITCHLQTEISRTSGFAGNFTSTLRKNNGEKTEIEHGVTIVATGGQEYRGAEYGYGSHPRILTQSELETLLAANAKLPTLADPLEIDLESIKQTIMIQCVGPAEQYCARTCCTTALKNALLLKERKPEIQVIVLYKDIRTYGFYERLYKAAREKGVIFLRYDDAHRPQVQLTEEEILQIKVTELTFQKQFTFEPDLVVLSMPLVPSDGNRTLATTLKVPVDQDGWFLEAHVKLRPVEFASDGIFLAGVAHYPKMLDEAIVQAQAAASRAVTILASPERKAGGAIAQVDPELCVGCLTCVRVCPFEIPRINTQVQGVGGLWGAAYIEPSVCQGCGTCVAACPAEAIELLHYRHAQVESQVFSVFEVEWIDRTRKR